MRCWREILIFCCDGPTVLLFLRSLILFVLLVSCCVICVLSKDEIKFYMCCLGLNLEFEKQTVPNPSSLLLVVKRRKPEKNLVLYISE